MSERQNHIAYRGTLVRFPRRPYLQTLLSPRRHGDECRLRGRTLLCWGAGNNDFARVNLATLARIRSVFADKGYDAEHHRDLCRRFGAEPRIHKRRQQRGSGLGGRRWPVERSNAWLLENRRLALR